MASGYGENIAPHHVAVAATRMVRVLVEDLGANVEVEGPSDVAMHFASGRQHGNG